MRVVSVKDSKLYVKFQGTCVGCPISLYTLKLGIEQKVTELVPEITEVIAVDDGGE